MSKNLGGRGKKNKVSKKAYWIAADIGEPIKAISERYENLSEIDPNQARALLDEIETLLLKTQK